MKSGRVYKKVLLSLDQEAINELRELDPKTNLSEIVRNCVQKRVQKLGLKKEEEKIKE